MATKRKERFTSPDKLWSKYNSLPLHQRDVFYRGLHDDERQDLIQMKLLARKRQYAQQWGQAVA